MHPFSFDDFLRPHNNSTSLGDNNNSPPSQDQQTTTPAPEHVPVGRSKKKAKGAGRGKDRLIKQASSKALDEAPQPSPSPPFKSEPSSLEPQPVNHAVVSPVLDALGALADDSTSRTGTWAKSIPFAKSPPIEPSDFPSGSSLGILNTEGTSHPSSASPTSPPRTAARPLSFGNGYPVANLSRRQSVDRQKSLPMGSPFYHHQIPPPHLPQAHFYGAPDIGLPFLSGPVSDGGYSFCSFDVLPSSPLKMSAMGGNVLLVGCDGALDVLSIENGKTRLIAKIAGLNGRVVDAAILSSTSDADPFAPSKPHVAVILHGPVPAPSPGAPDEGSRRASLADLDINEAVPRRRSVDRRHRKEEKTYYQTRVEVYSLRTGQHFGTLFTSTPVPHVEIIPGFSMSAPSPIGNLKLHASDEGYVVLTSGESGEVFVYGPSSCPDDAETAYRCMGKTWTVTHSTESRRYSASSSSTDTDGSRSDSPHSAADSDKAVVSLRGRWLAIVPPSSTYKPSIRGTVSPSMTQGHNVLGLETLTPPSRPPVTCTLDCGERESLLNRVARGVTQELFKGARWMGDQGLHAWNNYWGKEPPTPPPGSSSSRRSAHMDGYSGAFPPTHAQDTQTVSPGEPEFVSIIDLKHLEDAEDSRSVLVEPSATFEAPSGCSFLSFSPNGLMLLTASKKGDVQHVWDLMQMRYCRAGTLVTDEPVPPMPSVRQLAWYARLTTSTIVDVVWKVPEADRLAIITRKGTVHVYDMPPSAFQWPPFRRVAPPSPAGIGDLPGYSSIAISDERGGPANNALSAAIKLVGGKTQPILAAVRGRTVSGSSAMTGKNGFAMPTAAGSGKVVAAGLSKSVGAATGTVNTIRQAGGNRLHLSGLSRSPAPSRVSWVTHKGHPFLGVVDSGFFRMYAVGRVSVPGRKNRQLQSVIGKKEMEFRLPPTLQNTCGPMPVGMFDPESTSDVQASFALPSYNYQLPSAARLKCQPLSQAEIETNAPYQPFHTDQRVNLHVFSTTDEDDPGSSEWVFGDDIPMSRLHVRPLSDGDDDGDESEGIGRHDPGGGGERMENLISLGNSTDNGEEVVITTRRKKPSPAVKDEIDDGFFEDDCEVLDFARDRV